MCIEAIHLFWNKSSETERILCMWVMNAKFGREEGKNERVSRGFMIQIKIRIWERYSNMRHRLIRNEERSFFTDISSKDLNNVLLLVSISIHPWMYRIYSHSRS